MAQSKRPRIYSPFRYGYRTQDIYKAEEIDFLLAYIAPRDIWYVIPVKHMAASRVLLFYPSGCKRGGHFERYREAWYLMASGAAATAQSGYCLWCTPWRASRVAACPSAEISEISPSYIDTHPAGP